MGVEVHDAAVLIVDDSEITRRILRTIMLSRRWTVSGEAENGWSGVKKFLELKPDVVLLDLAMLDINGNRSRQVDIRLGPDSAPRPVYDIGCYGD